MAVLANKLAASRADCAPLAGKSTLNRLELSKSEPTRYNKIDADPGHRAAAWPSGRQVLPRLLRLLLLSATVCLLRPPPAGGQTTPCQHRRRRRDGGRDGAHRPSDTDPLAEGTRSAARRQRLLPRGADGVVRGGPGGLRVRPGPQRAAGRRDCDRTGRRPHRSRKARQAGAPVQGFSLVHAGQLEPRAACHRQGGVDTGSSRGSADASSAIST